MELSVRDEKGSDSLLAKYSAIGNKRAVPNRLPTFDKGYEDAAVDKKSGPVISKKESSVQDKPAKNATGVKGMFDKQNETTRDKTIENKKDVKKEVQTNAKPKTTQKNSNAKGTRCIYC